MSWWTEFRDTLQSIATVVVNYYYPGSGIIANALHSKGSQEMMASELGQIAMIGSGAFGGAAGNMSNYGSTLNAISGGSSAAGAATDAAGYGFTGTSTLGAQQEAAQVAQQMIANGASPAEAIQMAGITPQMAEQSGLTAGAGQTWSDVAMQSGISYSGAGPQFTGQNIAGAAGTPGTTGAAPGTFGGGTQPTPATAASASAGAMPWGSPGNVSTMANGLYGLMEAQRMGGLAQQAQQQADPFGPQRKQYGEQMAALAADPSLLTKQPGYEAGLQAIKRTMASQGYTGSGNMMAALAKYGGDFYNQTMNNYANWAGAGFNPAAGAQLGLQGQMAGTNLAMNSLGLLGKGATMAGNRWPGYGG